MISCDIFAPQFIRNGARFWTHPEQRSKIRRKAVKTTTRSGPRTIKATTSTLRGKDSQRGQANLHIRGYNTPIIFDIPSTPKPPTCNLRLTCLRDTNILKPPLYYYPFNCPSSSQAIRAVLNHRRSCCNAHLGKNRLKKTGCPVFPLVFIFPLSFSMSSSCHFDGLRRRALGCVPDSNIR